MKHVFVVNPKAGGEDRSTYIARKLQNIDTETEIYVSQAPRDATRYVAEQCRTATDDGIRFYACGGDGTLNEVVTGICSGSWSIPVEVSCYPCGSGNDYIKYWPQTDFTDLQALSTATAVPVDVMRVGDRCCINTLNFGFEAEVCRTMADVRRKPFIGGRMAYTTGIVKSLATSRKNYCRINVDGQTWFDGVMLLASLANGIYAGGGYRCAPRAINDDSLLEVMAIRPLSLKRFAMMIGHYEHGEHLDRPDLKDVIQYCRGQRVTIESDHPFHIAIDGELLSGTHFEVENMHQKVFFAIPQ